MINKIKNHFFSNYISKGETPANTEKRWKEFQHTANEGVEIFLEYAKTRFDASYYRTILSSLEEANHSLQSQDDMHKMSIQISKELLNAFYIVAKELFEKQLFTHSYSVFYILSFLAPNSIDVWLGLGLNYQQLNQQKKAIDAFLEAQKIHPEYFFTELYLAESYCMLSNWKQAYAHSLSALNLASNHEPELISALNAIKAISAAQGKVA